MPTKKKSPQVVIHTEEVYMAIEEDGALTIIEWIPNKKSPENGEGEDPEIAGALNTKVGEGVI